MATKDQVMTCPYCGGTVPLDAPECPNCHEDLSALARLEYGHTIYYNEGLALAQEGKLDQARDRLLVAVAQKESFAPAHALLAKVYANQGEWPKARASAKRAAELLPQSEEARELVQQIDRAAARAQQASAQASRARADSLLSVYLRDVAKAFGLGVGVTAVAAIIASWLGGGGDD